MAADASSDERQPWSTFEVPLSSREMNPRANQQHGACHLFERDEVQSKLLGYEPPHKKRGQITGSTSRAMSHIKREEVPEIQPRTAASGAKDRLHLTQHTNAMPASERFSPYNLPYPPWARVLLVGIGKKLR